MEEEFLAFVRSKPAQAKYSYTDNRKCPFAQFLRASGRASAPWVGGNTWTDEERTRKARFTVAAGHGAIIPRLIADVLWPSPHTWGALGTRLAAELNK